MVVLMVGKKVVKSAMQMVEMLAEMKVVQMDLK